MTGKRTGTRAKSVPDRFFAKELGGEQAPSRQTMEELFGLSLQFRGFELWELMTEEQLVVVDAPATREPCYCSIMGMRGEVRALQVYQGERGLQFFKRANARRISSIGEFYGLQRSVYVHYVMPGELDTRDRAFLRAVSHPYQHSLSPQFRCIRPGYFPWYVTEDEGQLLAHCLRAMVQLARQITEEPGVDYWETENLYPKLEPATDGYRYEVRMVAPPSETLTIPVMPRLDQEAIELIKNSTPAKGPVLEVDHFYGGARIGNKDERGACVRLAMAIDAETAYAYKPELAMPDAATGDMLVRAVLNAVTQAEAIPGEVRVREREYKTLLGPLGEALGCPVKLVESLPALEHARGELLAMMGEPASLTGRRA